MLRQTALDIYHTRIYRITVNGYHFDMKKLFLKFNEKSNNDIKENNSSISTQQKNTRENILVWIFYFHKNTVARSHKTQIS